tara:strand:+ start:661 stop:840 length:180 start_codon:yes stop_codon:yes gene_type:complete
MFISNDQDFEEFCRLEYDKISMALEIFGIDNDEDFETFLERNYTRLESKYINSIDKTIH